MKKYFLTLLLVLSLSFSVFGADTKITGLDADTAPDSADLVVTVDAVATTPVNKKTTIANLTKGLSLANFPAAANVVSLLSADNYAAIRALATDGIYAPVAQTFYFGTTQIAINRGSATLDIAGIGTISAGGGGFTVDADGDVVAKSFTATKVSGQAGASLLYEANSTDTNGMGWKGPASRASDLYLQFPDADPAANQMLLFPAPTTGTATAAWVTVPNGTPVGGTLGATANVIPKSSGTGAQTLAASGISEDGTTVNLGVLDLLTSGTIRGGVKTILMGTGATYTFSAVDAYGSMIIQDDADSATTINLPNYDPNATAGSTTKVKLGASFCVLTLSAFATIINPADDDKIRTSNGTLNALGATITGPATVGAYSCYLMTDAQATKGTASGATTDATGYVTTTTTVALDSAGTGTILAGDIITFIGDTTKYTVTSGDADVSGGGNITFTPGLAVALEASTHAITVVETGTGHWTQLGMNGAWPVTP